MDTKKIVATFCASLLLAGCGGWNQNPLDGKKGDFGGGKGVPTKPDFSKPLASDTVLILAPSFQSFEEGVKAEFEVSARVLREGYTADVQIENLSDFPGATYNKATKLFSWTPPIGFVTAAGAGERAEKPLKIRAFGYKPDDQVLYDDEERPMYIARAFNAPEILSVSPPQNWIREGTTLLVPVVVLDKDAIPADATTWPKLLLQSYAGTKSLAGLTTLLRDESLGNSQYRTQLQIDVRDVELTDAIDSYRLQMVAASRFGKLSPARYVNLDVYTSFATPVSTWPSTLELEATKTVEHKFLITDPKIEALLAYESAFNLPEGATIGCTPAGRGILSCLFTWTPTEAQVGNFDMQLYVNSRNYNSLDTFQVPKTIYLRMLVRPVGS